MTSPMFSRLIVRFETNQSDALALSMLMRSRTGMAESAVELLAAARKLEARHSLAKVDKPPFSQLRAQLEAAVDTQTFAAAWQRGEQLDPVAAVQTLLDEARGL